MSDTAKAELRNVCGVKPGEAHWGSECRDLEVYLAEMHRHCEAVDAMR